MTVSICQDVAVYFYSATIAWLLVMLVVDTTNKILKSINPI